MTRGSEIVYCFKCSVRLSGRDLESGAALRFADFYSCATCARALLSSLSARRQQVFAERIEKTHAETASRAWKRRLPALL